MTDRVAALRLQFMAGELAQQIGARIRQRRLELGLNQTQLAGLIKSDAVNNQRVSDWERGVHKPSERYMEELAQALQRDVSWLYAGDASAETPDLMGALQATDASQLDRIEAKLDLLLGRVGGMDPADFTEAITQHFEDLDEPPTGAAGRAAPGSDKRSDAKKAGRPVRAPRKRRTA